MKRGEIGKEVGERVQRGADCLEITDVGRVQRAVCAVQKIGEGRGGREGNGEKRDGFGECGGGGVGLHGSGRRRRGALSLSLSLPAMDDRRLAGSVCTCVWGWDQQAGQQSSRQQGMW